MGYTWIMTIEDYFEVVNLAKSRGKTEGDSMEEEFLEIAKKKESKIKLLGKLDKDIDLLSGDLREHGFRVLNMKEEERKSRRKDDENN